MKNWRTTILGVLLAVLTALLPYITEAHVNWAIDWPRLVVAAGIAAVGFLLKDPEFMKWKR